MILWRYPDKKTFELMANPVISKVELNDTLLLSKGFIFHPFDSTDRDILYFTGETSTENLVGYNHFDSSITKEENNIDLKDAYIQRGRILLDELALGSFHKLVLARRLKLEGEVETMSLFFELCEDYPMAFVYLINVDNEYWLGATPELFLKLTKDKLCSAAVAGTRANINGSHVPWEAKELEEQQIVKDYIKECFNSAGYNNVEVSSRKNKMAGNVFHLENEISVMKENNIEVSNLIRALHPTPAVAGIPKQKALKWIHDNEGIDREYYTGFLGPTGEAMSLFVNLRCMKIKGKAITLFVGGGYTEQSNVEDEWDETVEKSKTLLNVLLKQVEQKNE